MFQDFDGTVASGPCKLWVLEGFDWEHQLHTDRLTRELCLGTPLS